MTFVILTIVSATLTSIALGVLAIVADSVARKWSRK